MAGKKGMRHFGAAIIEEVLRMKSEGKTNRAISKHSINRVQFIFLRGA